MHQCARSFFVWPKNSRECAWEFQARHKSSSLLKDAPVSSGLEIQGILRVPPLRENRAYKLQSPGHPVKWAWPRPPATEQFSSSLASGDRLESEVCYLFEVIDPLE